jgi:hypothetical protein
MPTPGACGRRLDPRRGCVALAQKQGFQAAAHRVYAQNVVCSVASVHALFFALETPHADRKSLILLDMLRCTFSEQSNQGLDFQALARRIQALSTKLSTETLGKSDKPWRINDLPVFSPK